MNKSLPAADSPSEIEACLTRMRTLARRMLSRYPHLRRWDETSDLVHDAFIRLHIAMQSPQLESPRSLVALAVTQLNRELVDAIRRNQARQQWSRMASRASPCEWIDDSLEDWTRFHDAVEALPHEQRDAVQLVWYLGFDQREAAEKLGVSVRTLRRYWHDGRAALKQKIGDLAIE